MELRKDYLTDSWVIIAEGRGKRPQQLAEEKAKTGGKDFFAPGNEKLTPPEIGRIGKEKWRMRWFENKFPAVEPTGNFTPQTDNSFFTFADAYGYHEIIVETPSKTKQLWDLKENDVRDLLEIYKNRITELAQKDHIGYVSVFKNHGSKGGASIAHSHTQVVATAITPPNIQVLLTAAQDANADPYSAIIDIEKASLRRCFENDHALAFTPYASRFNYEMWIFPKEPRIKPADCTAPELNSMAELLYKALQKLKSLNVSYNFYLYYAPTEPGFRFHIRITPRIANWAGFELSSGIIINTVSPEQAAAFYRDEVDF